MHRITNVTSHFPYLPSIFSVDKEEASQVWEESRGSWTERCVRDAGPPVQGGEVGRCVQRAHRSAPGQR